MFSYLGIFQFEWFLQNVRRFPFQSGNRHPEGMDVISLSSSSSANIPCGWFHETYILAKDSLVNKLDKLLLFLSMASCLCCGPYLQEQKVAAEEKKEKEHVSYSESLIALRHNDEGIHAPRAVFFLHLLLLLGKNPHSRPRLCNSVAINGA